MNQPRSSGILLHPTSLPGPDGIGDLGPESYRWLDFLAEAGCQLWQILPLGPTGYGDSPYQCFSAFAGNPYLISPALLMDDDLIMLEDLADRPAFPEETVDFGPAIIWKVKLLEKAYQHFKSTKKKTLKQAFDQFKQDKKFWLQDYALFMAIKTSQNGVSWENWDEPLRKREQKALDAFISQHEDAIEQQCFYQFIFFKQWDAIRDYAHQKDIKIIGDIPFVIAYDSADVWANPDLFYLDKHGLPTVVAGVPPDYFSSTGQLWGNPLYIWENHKKTGYNWWFERIKSVLTQVDIIRLDHFRGFEAYWEVPYGNPTAEHGVWKKGPGFDFFDALQKTLGDLPLIAEDLGLITPEVDALRMRYNLPGMKIMQFGFAGDTDDSFLPHNYTENYAAYTGSHDNNTVRGWFDHANYKEQDLCRRYLARADKDIVWAMIRNLWQSIARLTLSPMQDFLELGEAARMNFPGKASGNWQWRMKPEALTHELASYIFEINYLYGRLSEQKMAQVIARNSQSGNAGVKPH